MKKFNLFKKLELWWFYLSDDDKNVINFFASILLFLTLLAICLFFGYAMGKAGIGS